MPIIFEQDGVLEQLLPLLDTGTGHIVKTLGLDVGTTGITLKTGPGNQYKVVMNTDAVDALVAGSLGAFSLSHIASKLTTLAATYTPIPTPKTMGELIQQQVNADKLKAAIPPFYAEGPTDLIEETPTSGLSALPPQPFTLENATDLIEEKVKKVATAYGASLETAATVAEQLSAFESMAELEKKVASDVAPSFITHGPKMATVVGGTFVPMGPDTGSLPNATLTAAAPTVTLYTKLIDATELYQPVGGTNESSRYYVIAIGDGIKIAARIREDHTTSIRAEGDMDKWASSLHIAGLASAGGGHYSVHYKPSSKVLAYRSIGSALFAMGTEFNTPMPDLNKIYAQGV